MKLVRFGPRGDERPGVWLDTEADGPMILDVRGMAYDIEDYDARFFESDGLTRLAFLVNEPARVLIKAGGLRLGAPVAGTGAIVCLGKNYGEHVREFDARMPDHPIVFCKAPASLNGPRDPIVIPDGALEIDGEVEAAAVIGRQARRVPVEHAMEYVAGYTLLNDVTDRAAQRGDGQWFRAKSADTFCPLGPFLVTADEGGIENRRLCSRLNGKMLQEGNTSQMLFGLPEIIAFITRSMTLRPGDIVSTGTPSGIGSARKPPLYLKEGDVLETEVEGLGCQQSRIIAAKPH